MIPRPIMQRSLRREAGGITIIVALMLLSLLTVVAFGLSRGSFREVITAGTVRQGQEVRNLADSGLEWGVYWVTPEVNQDGGVAATNLVKVLNELSAKTELQGLERAVTPAGSMTKTADGVTREFGLTVVRMGQLPVPNTSETLAKPDLWSVRANAQLKYANGITFNHRRESWILAPPRVIDQQ